MKKTLFPAVVILSALFAGQLMAQGEAMMLTTRHYGPVTFVSGGIGDEEQREIRARERDFNLKLVFAGRDGSYFGDVDVAVVNQKGDTVLEAYAVGPFLLAQLPKGKYRIKAIAEEEVRLSSIEIAGQGLHERVLRW